MINWWLELTMQERGVVVAMFTGVLGAGLGVYNFVVGISERRWSRTSDLRLEQRELRKALRDDLAALDVAMRAFPELTMGLHGYPSIPEPPSEFESIEHRLGSAIGRTGDDRLDTALKEKAPAVSKFLRTWDVTAKHQSINAANPARSNSSGSQIDNLARMVEGKTKLRDEVATVRTALRAIIDAHDARQLEDRRTLPANRVPEIGGR